MTNDTNISEQKLVYIKTPGCRNTVSEIFGGMRKYAQGCSYIRIFTLLIAPTTIANRKYEYYLRDLTLSSELQ
ncbi:hypothetical protein DPMN_174199 [Dreissena polymorpha]|uniref:Uncharacterized protein n=1 Tax=Dreissena polymorpha TaxID=45954 RepID=A0A9D4IHM7_DREPO|nr:hypothetical protein DPMN_174199 [Dreissena polymorpha]